jgi:flavin-binding protein dodecin
VAAADGALESASYIGKLDMTVENGKVAAYRARMKLSFKYEG